MTSKAFWRANEWEFPFKGSTIFINSTETWRISDNHSRSWPWSICNANKWHWVDVIYIIKTYWNFKLDIVKSTGKKWLKARNISLSYQKAIMYRRTTCYDTCQTFRIYFKSALRHQDGIQKIRPSDWSILITCAKYGSLIGLHLTPRTTQDGRSWSTEAFLISRLSSRLMVQTWMLRYLWKDRFGDIGTKILDILIIKLAGNINTMICKRKLTWLKIKKREWKNRL